jgi:HD superfamily phosphohydrolase
MHQLGLAHLVFRGATHKRFEHVLGTVAVVQRMVDAVNHNSRKRHRNQPDAKDRWVLARPLTPTEERFIRLAALLHDIGHVPFGHTFEDELHLLNKHDEMPRLNRILSKDTWPGSAGEKFEALASLIDGLYQGYLLGPVLVKHRPSELVNRTVRFIV